jgi:uncharacterized repeat protein (TIGR01451 family)
VSFGESAYLVTWTNDPFTNGAGDVFGKLITPSPMTISPTITISNAPQSQGDRKAGIAFGAGHFLVVFDDHRNGGDDIYATRVSESGVVQDPSGVVIATDTGCSPHEPKVAFAETMWVVVWGCPQVKGVRVDTSGVVIDTVPGDLTITNSATVVPEIAFDGEHFLVTFGRLSSQASHAQLVGLLTANLSITQSGLPDPAVSNGDITYSVAVTNHGPNLAPSIAITDALPPGTTFVSASVPGGICSYASGTVVCNLGRTFAGTTTTATIIVKATTAGTMTNSATVTSLADDPEPGNNTTSISTTVNAAANLTLSKIGTPNPVYVGNTLTYTLTIGNIGPSQATDVTLTDPLPASVTVISVASSQGVCVVANPLSCWLGTLADGTSANVTITVIPTAEGSITNSASVTAAEGDPNPGNNVASTETVVLPAANLGVTMVATPNALLAGFNLTYSIIVSNAGPSMATQVLLNDSLPLGVLVVSATPSQGTCTTGPTILCALGTIANGSNASATIVVTPTVAGSLTNSVSVAGSEADFVPGNNTDSVSTTVTAAPDLSITHSSSPNPVFSGSNLTYTINVANAGPSTATGVTIVDSLPAGVTFVSASTSQGTCSGSGPVSCVLGNLPSGGAAAAMIVVRPASAGTIVNTASVMANESDPNPGNNTATATTTVNPPSPPQQISDLIALLDSFNLPPPANSLRNKLLGIQNKITQNQLNAACNDLMAFNNEVMAQTGKLLTPGQANELITGANQLRMTLGC